MVLQITNTCGMNCPHCMQRSSIEPQHMEMKTVDAFLEMLLDIHSFTVGISGGEPLMHPQWFEIVDKIASKVPVTILITNGFWCGCEDMENKVIHLLKKFNGLSVQITSIRRFYRNHEDTLENVNKFKLRLKENGLKHRLDLTTDGIHVMELGRACDNESCRQEARADMKTTTSCFASAVLASQCNTIQRTILRLDSNGKFCHPFIDWKGDMHWSESWLCPSFASVFWHPNEISKAAVKWRPCGKCTGYQKLLERNDDYYPAAKKMLGIT